MKKRLFFALWPDESIRQQCGNVIKSLPVGCGQPVKSHNLHVTLLFLGAVDAEQEAAIINAVARLVMSPMVLDFNQLSFWQKPGVLCLTSCRFDQTIVVLVEQMADIARKNGIVIDERPYRPHITLARKAKCAVSIVPAPIIWRADNFCLVESCSTAEGVEYRLINRWG